MSDSENPSTNSDRKRPVTNLRTARPPQGWTIAKWTLLTFFCLTCAAGGTVVGAFWRTTYGRAIFSQIGQHPLQFAFHPTDPLAPFTPDQQFPPEQQSSINVLLMGCDHDYEERRPVPIMNTPGRSDAILLAHVDFEHNLINVLSIPRDAAVRIPGHGITKINSAHSIGGNDLSVETIRSVFGVQPDYYVSLNFEGFQKIVDALGGVDVTVPKPLNYDDNWGNLHVHLKPGFQHLNGYKAMGYVRIRHSDNDFMRAERQHEFLEALRSRVVDPSNFLKMPAALNALSDNLQSNLKTEQMLTLANFARKLPRQNIQLATLPCLEGPSYVYIKVPQSTDVIRKMFFYADPLTADGINVNVPGGYAASDRGLRYASDVTYVRHPRGHRRRHGQRLGAPASRDDNPSTAPDADAPSIDNGDNSGTVDKSGEAGATGDPGTSGGNSEGKGGNSSGSGGGNGGGNTGGDGASQSNQG
ncbi:MAG TPA: LCP family protein [Chthonomonadaceae bacterium]|nr:LCP family protein [Chthonomonadaceae bacterium]